MEKLQNLSFFDFFGLYEEAKEERKPDVLNDVLADVECYLQKGKVLDTLARAVSERELKAFALSDVEEKLFSINVADGVILPDLIKWISTKITRPLLRLIFEDEYMNGLMDLIHEDFHVSIQKVSAECPSGYVTNRLAPGDCILELIISEEGYAPLKILGTQNETHSAGKKNVLYRNGVLVADLADVLSFIIILTQVKREFARFDTLSIDELCEDIVFNSYTKIREQRQKDFFAGGIFNYGHRIGEGSVEKRPLFLLQNTSSQVLPAVMAYFAEGKQVVFKNHKALREEYDRLFAKAVADDCMDTVPYCLDRASSKELLSVYFMHIRKISYHDFLSMHGSNYYWPFLDLKEMRKFPHSFPLESCILKLYQVLHNGKSEHLLRAAYFSDYATCFEQKKNIPKKILSAMATSSFNKYFGYVEMDAQCDVDAVEEAAKEFIAIKEKYLPFVDSSSHSLRIRKLGDRKALGIYSPVHKCLCIDISSPSSMIHEYAHLIDHEYGNLSDKQAFVEIKEWYSAFMKGQKEDYPKLSGKTKYNLEYFLIPTEIFARSMELYFTDVLGVNNSLVKREYGFAYPEDEEFKNLVKTYFDSLFLRLQNTPAAPEVSGFIAADGQ